MPLFRAGGKLIYYAHVPKCGGSSIASYLTDRFGALGFHDEHYVGLPEQLRWTRTSPQHVDAATLERLLPLRLFDAIFTVVRHPVQRLVSTYHFQLELAKSIPGGTTFASWLSRLETDQPFAYDNHIVAMDRIVPEGAAVFHMEHGLDALVGWLDLVTGSVDCPRAILAENRRGEHVRVSGDRIKPTEEDLQVIGRLYRKDFERFGYVLDSPQPLAASPILSAAFLAERDAALAAARTPIATFRRKIKRRLARL
jgi:hypothetical protein